MRVREAARATNQFLTDEQRWTAVVNRDPAADRRFYYAVKTTGVYCRCTCPSKRASRKNVTFFDSAQQAEKAGYRPCKRCRPNASRQPHADAVVRACRLIEKSDSHIGLTQLAEEVGLSPHHFQRIFKAQTGVTPKQYSTTIRNRRVKNEMSKQKSVTAAIYKSGFNSNGHFYEAKKDVLGMTPTVFRSGGAGKRIQFATSVCWLGKILVAATERGICCILLGEDEQELVDDLRRRFPRAELSNGDARFQKLIKQVVGLVNNPNANFDLPLDICGTAFQCQVWEALRKIPAGKTTSYREIAKSLGHPTAVRAVGRAIATNPIAVAVPCHRVIRSDGSLAGYRWGTQRKTKLLDREKQGRG